MALSAVNGQFYDFTCLQLRLTKGVVRGSVNLNLGGANQTVNGQAATGGSLDIVEFNSISYDHKLEPEFVRGAHAQPLGRTRGNYEASGSITLYKAAAAALIKGLGPGYLEKEFDLTVTYGNQPATVDAGAPTVGGVISGIASAGFGAAMGMVTDELIGCRIRNDGNSHSQGGKALEVKLDLTIMQVRPNGTSALSSMPY
jgi:hypothetical protein